MLLSSSLQQAGKFFKRKSLEREELMSRQKRAEEEERIRGFCFFMLYCDIYTNKTNTNQMTKKCTMHFRQNLNIC